MRAFKVGVEFTDYYPKRLVEFGVRCQQKLDEIRVKIE